MNSCIMTCITLLTLAVFLSAVNPIPLRKRLPVGFRSVEQCNENNGIYVDKTEIALKLLKSGTNSHLFLRPRRFGKTFFLNTLESILLGKKDVFKDYFIGNPQNGYDWQIHRVLRLTFQEDDPINTLVRRLIKFANFYGVAETLADIEKTSPLYFEELLRELSPIDTDGSLKPGNLPPLALLIDEYDLPFKNSDTKIRAYFHEMLAFLKKLADEGIIKYVFFTGCNKVNLLPDYKNNTHSGLGTTLGIDDISLLPEYSTICGFTKDEIKTYFHDHVQEKAEKHNVTLDVIYNDIQVWYDGYRFTSDSQLLYNPISLIYYLREKKVRKPKNYWIKTQNHPRTAMEALIAARVKSKGIILNLRTHYTEDFLFQPSEDIPLPKQDEKDPKQDKKDRLVNLDQYHSLESILFQNGYLTIREHYPDNDLYSLRFPNLEIMGAFMNGVEIAVVEDDESIELHKKSKHSLQNVNVDEFIETYNIFLNAHFKLETEINSKECEAFLKSLLEILLKFDQRSSTPEWEVRREVWTKKSSGKGGEIDFLIGTSRYRIIIETKFQATPDQLEKAREQAANYMFPDSKSQGNKHRVRLVFNFNGNGIVEWIGTEYDAQDKFVTMLGEHPMEKSNRTFQKT